MLDLDKVLSHIKEWVLEIGAYQLNRQKENFSVMNKNTVIDMVTDVDIESEKRLRNYIEFYYPDHQIIGEEGVFLEKDNPTYTWVIDPIDGTTNYIHGIPFFCISIGIQYLGKTVLGLVYVPEMNYTFSAIRGQGAYFNEQRIHVSSRTTLQESVLATGFPYERAISNPNLPYFNRIINRISGIRRSGSAAFDLCMVAAGKFDGYWEFGPKIWDVCAGSLLVEEAGGKVSTVPRQGHDLTYAANPNLYSILEEILSENLTNERN